MDDEVYVLCLTRLQSEVGSEHPLHLNPPPDWHLSEDPHYAFPTPSRNRSITVTRWKAVTNMCSPPIHVRVRLGPYNTTVLSSTLAADNFTM